ncbi:hypothetical protein Droror1_Dr00026881 [Drosera rotundifolia]
MELYFKQEILGVGQKRGTSCIQGFRKSQRIQEAIGVCIEAVSTEPTPNLVDGTHVMVAQSSRLPAPPIVENNQYCTPPNIEGSMGHYKNPGRGQCFKQSKLDLPELADTHNPELLPLGHHRLTAVSLLPPSSRS